MIQTKDNTRNQGVKNYCEILIEAVSQELFKLLEKLELIFSYDMFEYC